MGRERVELAVGTFVIIGMACLVYLSVNLGKIEVFGETGNLYYGDFASVSGLKKGDPVEIAGVPVGRVESFQLADGHARVWLKVDLKVRLQEDAIASVRARGIIGDKYVLVTLGASDRLIPPGGKIRETESPTEILDLIGKYAAGEVPQGEKKK
jgi:phospholipid/cholesterol/gamma-HCH transport system substrate-binding protein